MMIVLVKMRIRAILVISISTQIMITQRLLMSNSLLQLHILQMSSFKIRMVKAKVTS